MTLCGQFMLDLSPGQTNRTRPDKTDKRDICGGPTPGQNGQMPLGMSVMSGGSGVFGVRVGEDRARNYPTKASIKTAFDAWTDAGQPWPPPAGLTSAIASRLIPRSNRGANQWRK